VKTLGLDDKVFSDHTDLRPTLLTLAGLKDDYIHDGRVLVEMLDEKAQPNSMSRRNEDDGSSFVELARVYKQLNAPLGSVGRNSLAFATRSIKGPDTTYAWYLSKIADITSDRDEVANEIKIALDGAEFRNQPLQVNHAQTLINRAKKIIEQVEDLAHR